MPLIRGSPEEWETEREVVKGPQQLSQALRQLIALRGYARPRGDAQLQNAWRDAVGQPIAKQTRAVAIRRGVLHVSVSNSALLSELNGFHKQLLLGKLTEMHGDLKIKELKFKLDSNIKT
jgi:predicted nucleic acid-binding Zn ribbon protein